MVDVGGSSRRGGVWLGVVVASAVPVAQLTLGFITHAANVALGPFPLVVVFVYGGQAAAIALAVVGIVIAGRSAGVHGWVAWLRLFMAGVFVAYVAWLATALTINTEPYPY